MRLREKTAASLISYNLTLRALQALLRAVATIFFPRSLEALGRPTVGDVGLLTGEGVRFRVTVQTDGTERLKNRDRLLPWLQLADRQLSGAIIRPMIRANLNSDRGQLVTSSDPKRRWTTSSALRFVDGGISPSNRSSHRCRCLQKGSPSNPPRVGCPCPIEDTNIGLQTDTGHCGTLRWAGRTHFTTIKQHAHIPPAARKLLG